MNILVTGGSGYIGTHTLIALDEAGYNFIACDNLSNSSKESIIRVEKIINKKISFEKCDIRNRDEVKNIFLKYKIDAVIHFAGLKAVGESIGKPLEYYDNNVHGSLILLSVMNEFNCKKIVFSSSATVYGDPITTPIKENFDINITNPYGRSKFFVEEILKDLHISDNEFKIIILRYFNPVGAHDSGTIGEDPNGIPNNLMPFIAQTAIGKRKFLSIFGGDYDTKDGTGVRDYIHVVDLANGHIKALEKIADVKKPLIVNLGTGIGYSVLEVLRAYEKASSKKIPYKIVDRRQGDIAKCFADPSLAKNILNWEAKKTIEDMCIDSWKWQSMNPNGYKNIF